MEITLEQLKAENAKLDTEAEDVTATEAEEVEESAEEDDGNTDGSAAGQSEGEQESESEDWMKDDDGASEGSDSVPLAALVKTRTKLKGTIKEQAGELERLRQEIESLKKAPAPTAVPINIKPPKLEDFGYDESRFAEAQTAYIDAQINARLNQVSQRAEAQQQQEIAKQKLDEALSGHYSRAETLVKATGISEADYQAADTKLRLAVDQVMPGKGDIVVDALLANLGDGSEKVGYWLGRNSSAREELQRKLVSDPSGLSTAMWLGMKLKELSPPKQLRSNAPKPNTQMTGDGNSKDPHKDLKAKLAKARAKGDMQAVIDTKAALKAAGIDPKTL